MTKDNTDSFSSAFQKFLKSENLDQKFQEKKLVQSWEALMGKTIASRTASVEVRNKILYVKLTSAPLKQEMLNSRDKVLAIIQEKFGQTVETIRIL